ncbi:hypothetical protein [Streptomyces lateritius]|uniref:hypothetical protein n=1 Tax=Streptomyces lateritius TaxID=67313 RepID=UPI001677984E|nr:hypothetical protein [Streptomyces lateritius]GGT69284.1 hypothetical protein GCM10010272_10370 [Streptomyces lateritius]
MTVYDVARKLPGTDVLLDHCRGLAMLDAVLSPEWDGRYYSFHSRWSGGGQLASMCNGQGDQYSLVFSAAGVYIRGFCHESLMSPYGPLADGSPWPGVLDSVPEVFRAYVEEPAFTDEDGGPVVTACLWREPADTAWRTGTIDFPEEGDDPEDADGAGYLFELLVDRSAEAYQEWAEYYHETSVDLDAVRHVLALRPLTAPVVTALNPGTDLAALADDIAEIGYPA